MNNAEVFRKYTFRGHVQGVGFRWTTRQIAGGYPVTGYVRNLADGRVEMVACGQPSTVDRFVRHVKDSLADNIDGVDCVDLDEPVQFAGFTIRS